MTLGWAVPLIMVTMFAVLGGVGWFVAKTVRHHNREKQRIALAAHMLTGAAPVVVHCAQWTLPLHEIRAVAFSRGYVELPQPDRRVMVFGLDPNPYPLAVPAPPTQTQLAARGPLAARFASGAPVWVRAGEVGMTVAELDALARAHGQAIARVFGSRVDPVVLVSRAPVRRVDELVESTDQAAMKSFQRRMVGFPLAAVAVLPIGAGAALVRTGATPALVIIGSVVLAVLAVFLVLWWLTRNTRRDTTARVRLVTAEFDRGPVTVLANLHGVDAAVVTDVAGELGYRLIGSRHGWFPVTALSQTWLRYAPDQFRSPP